MKNSQRKNPSGSETNGKTIETGIQQMQQVAEERQLGLKGDYLNLLLLLTLYFLQGIPIGLIEALPLILVNKKVPYNQQAVFSIVYWPFSLKLLWAPIVDSFYSTRFGRRKSWFVPVQYGIGFFMIALSFTIDYIIGDTSTEEKVSPQNVVLLTIAFFLLIFLTATQDIAVDGWALTMLSKRNVEYAPSCNSVGQTMGVLFGNTVFLALESADFCNRWLRSTPSDTGIVSLRSYILFWGIAYLIVTTFVMLFKHEVDYHKETGETELNIIETYKMLWKILSLRTVRWFVLILLTCKIGSAASDAVTKLKLVQYGLKRQNLGLMKLPLIPLQLILPFIVTKFSIQRPMKTFYLTYPMRLLVGIVDCFIVWGTTQAINTEDRTFSASYYVLVVLVFALQMFAVYCSSITIWAFMARVSDPLIGGTYMTLLNTVSNIGGTWVQTVALYFVDLLSFQWCPENGYFCVVKNATAVNMTLTNVTVDQARSPIVDGYYVESMICILIGIFWMLLIRNNVKWLESVPRSLWRCKK
ncbi:acetyl-coenzyme A transporter-like protein, partial [Dinothrombium tinctorium]